jgi:hypothetical protein
MKLQIGDLIECEVQDNGRPRWSGCIDYGGTGRWMRGRVCEVAEDHAIVAFGPERWHVPLSGHSDYSYQQWDRPGFLRRAG